MRQIVLDKPGTFFERGVEAPSPSAGEALVRVHRIGVCGTDLHAFAGRQPFFSYPRVLGHELAVEIIEAPDNPAGLRPGDRCAVEPYLNCGACHACLRGCPNCCESLQVLGVHRDGGMQEFLTVPVRLLHKSDKLSLDQLALVETLGIGAHAVVRSGLASGDEALIVGAGPIGLAVFNFARLTGARIRVLELDSRRRGFIQSLGADVIAEPGNLRADVVFDATGSRASMEASFRLIAHTGRLVFVGLVQGPISFDDPEFHRRETTLIASRNSRGQFPRIIGLIEDGRLDTSPWITHRLSLSAVPQGFPALGSSPGLVKAVIEVDSPHA